MEVKIVIQELPPEGKLALISQNLDTIWYLDVDDLTNLVKVKNALRRVIKIQKYLGGARTSILVVGREKTFYSGSPTTDKLQKKLINLGVTPYPKPNDISDSDLPQYLQNIIEPLLLPFRLHAARGFPGPPPPPLTGRGPSIYSRRPPKVPSEHRHLLAHLPASIIKNMG